MKKPISPKEHLLPKRDFPAESIALDSPYIHSIWRGTAPYHGLHTAMADGNLDLVIMKNARGRQVLLSGPSSRAGFVPYSQGDENIGIRLRTGVHMPHLPSGSILDIENTLPNDGHHEFWLAGHKLTFPDFNNLDIFIWKLAKLGILQRDVVVENTIAGRTQINSNARMVQRHFIKTTGLTPNHISQIRRAELALALLQQGESFARIAEEAGYSHQSHMTNSFKYLLGHTPGQLKQKIEE